MQRQVPGNASADDDSYKRLSEVAAVELYFLLLFILCIYCKSPKLFALMGEESFILISSNQSKRLRTKGITAGEIHLRK